jgi:plasmid stability protein
MATTITIRHVPDEVRNELAARAARSGRSLQEFMLLEVKRLASRPSLEEIAADARRDARAYGADLDIPTLLADLEADRK